MKTLILNKMKYLFKKPYVLFVLGIFAFYLILSVFISGFNNTLPLIFKYASSVNWFKLGISLFFTLLIGVLVALNTVSIFVRYRERQNCRKQGILAGIGSAGGLVVGVCPLCITGIFPLLLSFIGVSFSFASLPFQGLEIQALIVVLLGVSLWMLEKK
jgi:hypothetical protein